MASDSFALVTGASGGIGLEIGKRLAARGHRLVVTSRFRESLEAAAEALRMAGSPEVVAIVADLAMPGVRRRSWPSSPAGASASTCS